MKAPDASLSVVGGILVYDGAGYYPGLELLNFVFQTEGNELLPGAEEIRLERRAHDFARRLVWDADFHDHPNRNDVLYDDSTEEALRHLLSCLQLKIPSTSKAPRWDRAHFFPYTRSLIHWDGRERGQRILLERRYLRGGGAMAFHILRMDPDTERLDRCRRGFSMLFPEGGSAALEKLALVLAAHGTSDEEPRHDQVESRTRLFSDELEDLYRDGTVNVLEHTELSSAARIRALTVWTGFWLLLAQHVRSSRHLKEHTDSRLICDCTGEHPQLRRASQRCLQDIQSTILRAAQAASGGEKLIPKTRNDLRGFFWATAATIKLLNSRKGRRHFIIGLDVLETLVLAGTEHGSEQSFEVFVDTWLYERCRLVVGRVAAQKDGLLNALDASIFEDNENALATQMKAAGLLTEYSDATRMVSTQELA